jgi:surface polysaccharide O-acyltransferase-like enzyme
MERRFHNLDRFRIIAALGVVWFHTEGLPGRSVAYGGLCFFLLTSFMLIGMKRHEAIRDALRKRFSRLIVPWLFWCAVYMILQIARLILGVEPNLAPYMVLTGTSIHLWYLPYVFVIAMAFHLLQAKIRTDKAAAIAVVTATISVVFCVAVPIAQRFLQTSEPVSQWLYGITACVSGWVVGRFVMTNEKKLGVVKSVVFLAAIILTCVSMVLCGFPFLGWSYVTGIGLFALALLLPNWDANDLLRRSTSMSMGIYLVHPLFGSVYKLVASSVVDNPYLKLAFVVFSSMSAVLVLKRLRILARFV